MKQISGKLQLLHNFLISANKLFCLKTNKRCQNLNARCLKAFILIRSHWLQGSAVEYF